MKIKEISYGQSRKLTTGKKYESLLISFSAKAEVSDTDDLQAESEKLKEFVKKGLEKEIVEYGVSSQANN